MYDVHPELIGKCAVDFLLVIIKLLSLDVTGEALQAKIDRKLVISLQHGQSDPKFQVEEDVLANHFCTYSYANECHTTLPLTGFTQKETL